MPRQFRLPVVSGDDVIKALNKFGYKVVHQRGSHVKMRRVYKGHKHTLTIPQHKELDKGTLQAIINKISLYLDPEEFIKSL